MSTNQAMVYVVEDDAEIKKAIGDLCQDSGLSVRLFAAPEEFLKDYAQDGPACLVLDVRFPATSPTGIDLQRTLAKAGITIPIIFISGHADIRLSVEAMKHGAVEFLAKPFREQELLDAIRHGLERDRKRFDRDVALQDGKQRMKALTAREREIMLLTAEGFLAKQIAAKLHVSEVTVKVHRTRMMKKLQLRSPVEVVRFVDRLNIGSTIAGQELPQIPPAADREMSRRI